MANTKTMFNTSVIVDSNDKVISTSLSISSFETKGIMTTELVPAVIGPNINASRN